MFSINHEYFRALASEEKAPRVDLVSGSMEDETVGEKEWSEGGQSVSA